MTMKNSQFNRAQAIALAQHFDAGETAFLERELTQVRTKLFEVVYAELRARLFLPMANDIAPSANSYVYKVWDRVGRAKIIANGVHDLPRVDVIASEKNGKVVPIGASYGWEINEMREAARLNVNLNEKKATAAARVVNTGIDEVLATGKLTGPDGAVQDPTDIEGFVNNSDVDDNIGDPDNDPWVAGTTDPADILADMATMASAIPDATSMAWVPDTMLFAPREYNIIASTPASDLTPGYTILKAFLDSNPYIKNIDQWHRLTAAGVGGKNRSITYKRDPEVLEAVVPQEFEQLPPEARGLEFIVNCLARCGGVKIYHPEAVLYFDHATS
jgi:hypothetical protein